MKMRMMSLNHPQKLPKTRKMVRQIQQKPTHCGLIDIIIGYCTMTIKVAPGANTTNAIKQSTHTVQNAKYIFAVYVIVTASTTIILNVDELDDLNCFVCIQTILKNKIVCMKEKLNFVWLFLLCRS